VAAGGQLALGAAIAKRTGRHQRDRVSGGDEQIGNRVGARLASAPPATAPSVKPPAQPRLK